MSNACRQSWIIENLSQFDIFSEWHRGNGVLEETAMCDIRGRGTGGSKVLSVASFLNDPLF